jgi:beta-lactamase regulating signal transducer with metallopeptidase domain
MNPMNAMATLFGSPLAQAIGWALLHLLWQGVLVAAILAASLALMQRQSAGARYLLSLGALIVLLALGTATAYRSYDPAAPPAPIVVDNLSPAFEVAPVADDARTTAATQPATLTWPERLASAAAYTRAHLPQIVFVWLAGVLLLSARLLGGWLRAHRIATRNAVDASPEWQRAAARLARALRLRQTVRLLESAAVEVPAVIGWLRPVVLLPMATIAGLSREQMEMILAHELAHIRRHDFFVNLLQAMVETLLFYHPAVWWISNRVRIERENCCDDVAVAVCGNPLLYARALTRLEELRIDPAYADNIKAVAANGGSLIARIRRLAGARAESPNGPSRWAAGAALLIVAVALLVAPALPLSGRQKPADAPQTAPAPEKGLKPEASESKIEVKATCDHDQSSDGVEMAGDEMPVPEPYNNVDVPEAASMVHVAPMVAVAPIVRAAIASAPAIAARASARAIAALDLSDIMIDEPPTPPTPLTPPTPQAMPSPAHPPRPPHMAAPRPWHYRNGRKIGENGTLSVDDLITLRSVGVTPGYVEEMRNAGLGTLSLDDVVGLRMQGVTARWVKDLRDAGIDVKDAENAVGLRGQGVTADYIAGMRAAGYANLTTKQIISLRVMGVTPEYVKQMSESGYKNLTADDLVSLRAQGVSPSLIKALADAGYNNLSVKDLSRLAAVGVNADFIRDLAKYRTK